MPNSSITFFFLDCLLQGQGTCPCCGGSCPQPCFTTPSERSKFSIETWGCGWRICSISKSHISSPGVATGLHRPHRLDSLTDSSLLQIPSEAFVLSILWEAWMLKILTVLFQARVRAESPAFTYLKVWRCSSAGWNSVWKVMGHSSNKLYCSPVLSQAGQTVHHCFTAQQNWLDLQSLS